MVHTPLSPSDPLTTDQKVVCSNHAGCTSSPRASRRAIHESKSERDFPPTAGMLPLKFQTEENGEVLGDHAEMLALPGSSGTLRPLETAPTFWPFA
jgi:hypothetical protein